MSLKKILIIITLLQLTVVSAAAFEVGERRVVCVDSSNHIPLTVIDFSKVKTLDQLESCVSHVAKRVLDYQIISDWLLRSGFQITQVSEIQANVMKSNYALDGRGILINAVIIKPKIPISLNIIDRIFAHSLSLAVITNQDGDPLEVQATLTRK